MMPRLDGFGFCKSLKTDIRTSHIPVVMLTAKASVEDRIEGLDVGADDYLAKPFNTDELQVRIRNLVKIRQSLMDKYSAITVSTNEPIEASDSLPLIDKQFLQKASDVIQQYVADSNLDVEVFAEHMKITPVQLRRKLKALTNQTVIEFIRNYRLTNLEQYLRLHIK